MIYAPLPVRGGCEEVEALGFGSLHFECNRGRAGESRPRAFLRPSSLHPVMQMVMTGQGRRRKAQCLRSLEPFFFLSFCAFRN